MHNSYVFKVDVQEKSAGFILAELPFRMSLGDQIGMKAQGLSVEALFYHGLPNPETLETMMVDLDDQLAENSKL